MNTMKFKSSQLLLVVGLATTGLLIGGAPPAIAGILSSGDNSHTHSGDDPWVIEEALIVGDTGIGSLEISGGSRVQSVSGIIGNQLGGIGTATISGPGSEWSNLWGIGVGSYGGSANLRIENGGVLNSQGGLVGYRHDTTGIVVVNGPGSRWNAASNYRTLTIGSYYGAGELRIENGGYVKSSGFGIIGFQNGSYGKVTVTGAGSVWEGDEYAGLSIAHGGEGDLIISNGGVVKQDWIKIGYSDSWWKTGTTLVSGSGSELNTKDLTVGFQGPGVLTIENGGVVNIAGNTRVGENQPRGEINFNNGVLNTGGLLASPGDLLGSGTINATGLVSDFDLSFDATSGLQQQFIINSLPGQNVTLNLDASDPGNQGALGVGFRGMGNLTISDGMSVYGGLGYLGYNNGSSGIALVSGPGSSWNSSSDLVIGRKGDGELRIENGGVVNVGGDAFLGSFGAGYSDIATGTVNQIDGNLNIAGDLILANNTYSVGIFNLMGGELDMGGGAILKGRIYGNSTFNFDGGTIRDAGLIDLDQVFVQRGGTLAPGASAGTTRIEHGYTITSGTIEIDLNGRVIPGLRYDEINVLGEIDLLGIDGMADAALDIALGFSVAIGESFTILTNDGSDPIIGTFEHGSTVTTEYEGRTYEFAIDYTGGDGNDITLTVTIPSPGAAVVLGIGSLGLLRRRRGAPTA